MLPFAFLSGYGQQKGKSGSKTDRRHAQLGPWFILWRVCGGSGCTAVAAVLTDAAANRIPSCQGLLRAEVATSKFIMLDLLVFTTPEVKLHNFDVAARSNQFCDIKAISLVWISLTAVCYL